MGTAEVTAVTQGSEGHIWSALAGGWELHPQGFVAHCPLKSFLCPAPSCIPAPARAPAEPLGAGHGFPAWNSFSKDGHQTQQQPRPSSFLPSPQMEMQRDFSLVLFWWLHSIDWDIFQQLLQYIIDIMQYIDTVQYIDVVQYIDIV